MGLLWDLVVAIKDTVAEKLGKITESSSSDSDTESGSGDGFSRNSNDYMVGNDGVPPYCGGGYSPDETVN